VVQSGTDIALNLARCNFNMISYVHFFRYGTVEPKVVIQS
jgi:hypothetical protein